MKNSILAISLCFAAILVSCNASKKSLPNLENGLISMRTTHCYGKCPVYTIKINGDGRAYYEGEANVEKMGTHFKKLSKDQVTDLFTKFYEAKFFEFEKEYKQPATDLPTTYIRMRLGANDQEILDFLGAPEELKKLEEEVAAIGALDGWEKYDIENTIPAVEMEEPPLPDQN